MAKTMPPGTLRHVMMDADVDTTLALVADMVGLTKDAVTQIVAAGLPLMATVANEDPWVFKAMFAQSVKPLPEPTADHYTKLGKNPKARQALATDFEAIYGAQTGTLHRDTASQSSATETQASQVLSATMPAVVKALGKENVRKNEMGFGRQLRNLNP